MAHGGKRPGSGRKKIVDKKIGISIYIKKSIIRKVGGIKAAKTLARSAFLALEK